MMYYIIFIFVFLDDEDRPLEVAQALPDVIMYLVSYILLYLLLYLYMMYFLIFIFVFLDEDEDQGGDPAGEGVES